MTEAGCRKKYALSAAAAFIFIFIYEWAVHSVLLHPIYMQTASVWRPMGEIQRMMPLVLLRHAALALLLAAVFLKCRARAGACAVPTGTAADTMPPSSGAYCPVKSGGACFGLTVGLLMGIIEAGSYAYIPIPASLAILWFAAALVEGLGVGIVLSAICHCCARKDA
ncbi:MAG: hypothetical protein JO089_09590 [Alphaproteobacteria bacterium]|nr:hypothetical protein [Alphaproteobacteria bacterium]